MPYIENGYGADLGRIPSSKGSMQTESPIG